MNPEKKHLNPQKKPRVSWLRRCYGAMMHYATKPQAMMVLLSVAFAESSFFPLPPDPLFVAMMVANRRRWISMALWCTVASVLGGIVGYGIGYELYETLGKWLIDVYGAGGFFDSAKAEFNDWGFWFIALKGFTPIPYKFVTIASGVVHYDFLSFITASVMARASRFFMLAALLYYFGPQVKEQLDKNLGLILLIGIVALVGGFFLIQYITPIKTFLMNLF